MIREVNSNLKYVNPNKCICEYRNFALINKKTNKIEIVYRFIDEYTNYDHTSYSIYMKITDNNVHLPYQYDGEYECGKIFDFDRYYIVECDVENMKVDIDVSLKREEDSHDYN